MKTRQTKYLLWFMVLVTIMACVPGAAVPVLPTIDPNAIGTFIIQTANVALTRTAAALPTQTPTPTLTSTPRATDTPEPTATSTVIFIFFTPTSRAPTTTATSTANATSDGLYACQVLGLTPANGTSFASRTDFDAIWTVRNTGQRNWNKDEIDYAYLRGTKLQKTDAYDLPANVKIGNSIDLIVDMVAPKKAGSYTTNWSLRIGSETFCTLSLTIAVQ